MQREKILNRKQQNRTRTQGDGFQESDVEIKKIQDVAVKIKTGKDTNSWWLWRPWHSRCASLSKYLAFQMKVEVKILLQSRRSFHVEFSPLLLLTNSLSASLSSAKSCLTNTILSQQSQTQHMAKYQRSVGLVAHNDALPSVRRHRIVLHFLLQLS